MRRVLAIQLLLTGLLAACVTVNVYFPAAAAEQAADRVIDTVTGRSGNSQPSESRPQGSAAQEPGEPTLSQTWLREGATFLLAAVGGALERMIPAAHAQPSANIDVSTPEIRAITASMQQRFGQLEKYFASGAIGLTADGLIEIRDVNAVPLAERALVKRLVSEDNRDRNALYAEIAKANGHPEWEPDIRRTFARRWIERGAKPGWYYQDSGGNWVQK